MFAILFYLPIIAISFLLVGKIEFLSDQFLLLFIVINFVLCISLICFFIYRSKGNEKRRLKDMKEYLKDNKSRFLTYLPKGFDMKWKLDLKQEVHGELHETSQVLEAFTVRTIWFNGFIEFKEPKNANSKRISNGKPQNLNCGPSSKMGQDFSHRFQPGFPQAMNNHAFNQHQNYVPPPPYQQHQQSQQYQQQNVYQQNMNSQVGGQNHGMSKLIFHLLVSSNKKQMILDMDSLLATLNRNNSGSSSTRDRLRLFSKISPRL